MSEIKLGNTDIPFVFRGDELMYPNYIKDGLVLHYDFTGMTNADENRGVATDLSGNGNHGTLQNFNFTEESGYDKNKLLFDGVDDIVTKKMVMPTVCTYETVFSTSNDSEWGSPISSLGITNPGEGFAVTPRSTGITISAGDGINRYSHIYFYTNPIPINSLAHLVAIYNGVEFLIFINGENIGKQPFNLKQNNQLNLGAWSDLSFGSQYDMRGSIFSTKLYNRPLSPEEIAHNYAIEKQRFGIE